MESIAVGAVLVEAAVVGVGNVLYSVVSWDLTVPR